MNIASTIFAALAALVAFSARADAQQIDADDQGSITSSTVITFMGPVQHNTETGPEAGFVILPVSFSYTDYFANFDLGGLPGSISDASLDLNIVADPAYEGVDIQDPTKSLELDLYYNPQTHNPGTDPSQFSNLNSGDFIGAADLALFFLQTDQRYQIGLNSLGIADLNAAAGEVTISGVLDSIGSSPVNSYVVDVSQPVLNVAVPEPAQGMLLVAGITGLMLSRRFWRKGRSIGFQG